MSEQWAEMLRANGLLVQGDSEPVPASVDELTWSTPQLIDLSGFKIIEITGDDASDFLQGQFCNDLSVVSSTHAQITGYCTPKGRLLALPTIVGFAGGYRVLVPESVATDFVQRLRMFIMRAKVVVTERDDWLCTGIIADESGNVGPLQDLLGALPAAPLDVASGEQMQLIRWHDEPHGSPTAGRLAARYLILTSVTDQLALWSAVDKNQWCSAPRWQLADIQAGVPCITAGVSDTFVPQMINLQLINGLSFTKGCYPGQEIVARMQYLGKLKRHMRLLHLPLAATTEASAEPTLTLPGDTLSTADDANAGIVVDAVRIGDSHLALLAVVKVSANTAPLRLQGHDLVAVDLPYALPSLVEHTADAG